MNIFEKRPLSLILCIGLGGFFLFSLKSPILRVSVIVIAILLGILSTILHISKSSRRILCISSIALIVASLFSHLYFDAYFKAYNLYDEEVAIVGTVEEVSESSSYSYRLLIKAESVNEASSSYRFYAYPSKADSNGIIEGTRISFTARLEGFSDESYTYNIAKGINAYASDIDNINILEYTDGSLRVRFNRLREYVTRYVISLSDADTGAILSALLLGEKDYLPDQLRLDFKRIGISHILALSGMHLAILSLGLGKLLLLLQVKKKWRISIIALFVLLYMALTGFSVSVVRAGVMLILSSLLFLLSRSKDSLTSLSVAVLIICLFTPYAIMDISLWLSALATFGIIAFSEISEKFKRPINKREKLLSYFAMGILASVFAISATMVVSAISFGGISVLSPITTLIFSLLAEVIMYLGCLLVIIGWIIPIGWAISPICALMTWLAGVFSSIKQIYASTEFALVTVAIIAYSALFYLFLFIKSKRPLKMLNLLVVLFLTVSLLPLAFTVIRGNEETVAYCSDNRCDELLIRSNGEVCLINSAQYSKNLAYTTLDFLEDAHVTYLDKYYLTHYSWSLDEDIETLTYNLLVDKIYIPKPRNEDEKTILKILYKCVEDKRTEIITFEPEEEIYVGDYTVSLLYSEPYGSTSINAFYIGTEDEEYIYLSSGMLEGDMADAMREYIYSSEYVILGDHGKKYKYKIYLDGPFENTKTVILHSNDVFLTQENMQILIDKGCEIYSHPDKIIYFK